MAFDVQNTWEETLTRSEGGVAFLHNGIVRTLITLSVLPILLSFGVLVYFVRPSEAVMVLHYNVYFGVDVLGIWWQTYVFPLLGLLLFCGHFLLARRFYEGGERIASYLMLLSAGMLAFGVFVASVSIAFINY